MIFLTFSSGSSAIHIFLLQWLCHCQSPLEDTDDVILVSKVKAEES